MKAIIRKDEDAVSPVIATILMVAITVVLAAVLYVMVSGLITPTGNAPKAFGATVSKSSNGANWVIQFQSVPTGLTAGTTFLTIKSGSGVTVGTGQQPLTSGTNHVNATVTYTPASGATPTSSTTLGAADTILIPTGWCYTGYQVQLSTSSQVLWSQTLS